MLSIFLLYAAGVTEMICSVQKWHLHALYWKTYALAVHLSNCRLLSARQNGDLRGDIACSVCSGCIASVPERNMSKNFSVIHFNIELIS